MVIQKNNWKPKKQFEMLFSNNSEKTGLDNTEKLIYTKKFKVFKIKMFGNILNLQFFFQITTQLFILAKFISIIFFCYSYQI